MNHRRWDVVFHYDLGRGLSVFAGSNDARQRWFAQMMASRSSTHALEHHRNAGASSGGALVDLLFNLFS